MREKLNYQSTSLLLRLVSQGKPAHLLSKEMTPIYKYGSLPLGRNRSHNHGVLLLANAVLLLALF